MEKLIKGLKQMMVRLFQANINMEHYWFFPKPVAIKNEGSRILNIKK